MKLARAAKLSPGAKRDRFSVVDFAEAAQIPVSRARRLIKDLGHDAETLMRAIENASRSVRARLR
jgi:hypothetical protein